MVNSLSGHLTKCAGAKPMFFPLKSKFCVVWASQQKKGQLTNDDFEQFLLARN